MSTGLSGVNYKPSAGSKLGENILDVESGCISGITNLHRHIHEGKSFEVYKIVEGLANNAKTYIEVKTPENESIHLKGIRVWITEGAVFIRLVEAPTLTTGTTAFTPVNRNRNRIGNDLIESGATVKVDPTGISGGDELFKWKFGTSGIGSQDNESDIAAQIEWVLAPNKTYLFELENKSGSAIDTSIGLTWYE